jgi:hypothetical protein
VRRFLTDDWKVTRIETSEWMLRILQSSKRDNFDEITTDDESWFQYVSPSGKMFAGSQADVLSRVRQSLGPKQIMITLFFAAEKLIVVKVPLKDMKFTQPYYVHYMFPDLKKANMNSGRQSFRSVWAIQWVITDQKPHRNSRSVLFPECLTRPIR